MKLIGTPAPSLQVATARLQAQAEKAASPEAKKAAREFEAVFLTQTVDEMLKSVDIGSFGGGEAEETWRSFLARAYADQIAEQNSTGIARSVLQTIAAYETATKAQEPQK
ncbi:rod-binding protein [Seohaeicola zhoushanensis]|uniref:Flagellar protein FlgJ N-terminal domain-containing protein n=1 Tax=Seohaeicola zhoushanensis TaxID=1569283 RepID=A0A8J3GUS0_9RHOB|nr:rod-binding protein [Seohaeicola zhoushanensis]GHF36286.1 hypothetical protein GCM10017056_05130 [Seohaeicola zhoushanensis]